MEPIPFNKPYKTGKELEYISQVIASGKLQAGGPFLRACVAKLESMTGSSKVVLTHSCTGALEMASLLLTIQPGDEVIMPSFTFVSTANPFVLRGAIPVFVDVRADTLNIDESLIEAAISPHTQAIVVVHYAGISCEMNTILEIAERHGIKVIEDAAHGIMATYNGRPLGSIGHLGTYSFHETKNLISGEGGCLLVNETSLTNCAETTADRGTDRAQFVLGQTRNYSWVKQGSAYQASELGAAFLWAQLQEAEGITEKRLAIWNYYHNNLEVLELQGLLKRPKVPVECVHNAHLYYILLPDLDGKNRLLKLAKEANIGIVEHYTPLHNSVAGKRYGKVHGDLPVTCMVVKQLVRIPLWIGLDKNQQDKVICLCYKALMS